MVGKHEYYSYVKKNAIQTIVKSGKPEETDRLHRKNSGTHASMRESHLKTYKSPHKDIGNLLSVTANNENIIISSKVH